VENEAKFKNRPEHCSLFCIMVPGGPGLQTWEIFGLNQNYQIFKDYVFAGIMGINIVM